MDERKESLEESGEEKIKPERQMKERRESLEEN